MSSNRDHLASINSVGRGGMRGWLRRVERARFSAIMSALVVDRPRSTRGHAVADPEMRTGDFPATQWRSRARRIPLRRVHRLKPPHTGGPTCRQTICRYEPTLAAPARARPGPGDGQIRCPIGALLV